MTARLPLVVLVNLTFAATLAEAGNVSIGYLGANANNLRRSDGVRLRGDGIVIGHVEPARSSSPNVDSPGLFNAKVVPDKVFAIDNEIDTPAEIAAEKDKNIFGPGPTDQHPLATAGILISSSSSFPGIVRDATLYTGYNTIATDIGQAPGARLALTLQEMATHGAPAEHARIINLSMSIGSNTDNDDGTDQYSQFIDWSANEHDVLYVISGPQGPAAKLGQLTASYNGIVVGMSERAGATFQGFFKSSALQRPRINANELIGGRTRVDILAPGINVCSNLPGTIDSGQQFSGTSFAAPHVTGVAAQLLEFANFEISNSVPRFDQDALRHEVIKSVILNSADKLRDTGDGHRLWQARTTQDIDGDDWLLSAAYLNADTPLDDEMGAGHLNGARALKQFAQGEFDGNNNATVTVPSIGWDYHTAPFLDPGTLDPEYVKYKIDTVLPSPG